MGRSYDAAAEAARDGGIIDKADVQSWQVRQDMKRFLQTDGDNPGAKRLLDRTTEAAMGQTLEGRAGETAGKRSELKVWEDTHGNIMYHNSETGERKALVDKSERGL